jgi:hypothetical protein
MSYIKDSLILLTVGDEKMREQKENDYKERLLDAYAEYEEEEEENDEEEDEDEEPEVTVIDIKPEQQYSNRAMQDIAQWNSLPGIVFIEHPSLRRAAQKEPYKSLLSAYPFWKIQQLEAQFRRDIEDSSSSNNVINQVAGDSPPNNPRNAVGCEMMICLLLGTIGLGVGGGLTGWPIEAVKIAGLSLLGSAGFCCFCFLTRCIILNYKPGIIIELYAPVFLQNKVLTKEIEKKMGLFANKKNNPLAMPIQVSSIILSYL